MLLRVDYGGGDLLRLVRLDLPREVQRLLGDEVAEAVPDAGNRRRVIGQHSQPEGNHQDQVGEFGEVKSATVSLRSGESGFDPEPDNQDHGQATEDIESRGLERGAFGGQQLADRCPKKGEWILLHGLPSCWAE